MYIVIVSFLLLTAIFAPLGFYYLSGYAISRKKQTLSAVAAQPEAKPHDKRKRKKLTLFVNLIAFTIVFILSTVFMFTGHAFANTSAPPQSSDMAQAAAFIGAALVTGLGAIGTGIAVSSTAAAAIGAISENENNFGKAMIFVAMAEGIAIYGLLISFMILGRV